MQASFLVTCYNNPPSDPMVFIIIQLERNAYYNIILFRYCILQYHIIQILHNTILQILYLCPHCRLEAPIINSRIFDKFESGHPYALWQSGT